MPSLSVDHAWHAFILCAEEYELFCKNAFGQFLHHTPATKMKSPVNAQLGIRRAWLKACSIEGIEPNHPTGILLLFSVDHNLNIPDGSYYVLNCENPLYRNKANYYCAANISYESRAGTGCGGSI